MSTTAGQAILSRSCSSLCFNNPSVWKRSKQVEAHPVGLFRALAAHLAKAHRVQFVCGQDIVSDFFFAAAATNHVFDALYYDEVVLILFRRGSGDGDTCRFCWAGQKKLPSQLTHVKVQRIQEVDFFFSLKKRKKRFPSNYDKSYYEFDLLQQPQIEPHLSGAFFFFEEHNSSTGSGRKMSYHFWSESNEARVSKSPQKEQFNADHI